MACPQPEDCGLVASLEEVDGIVGWVVSPVAVLHSIFCLLRSRSLPPGMWMRLMAGVSCYQTLPDDPRGHFLESHSELGSIVGLQSTLVVVSASLRIAWSGASEVSD